MIMNTPMPELNPCPFCADPAPGHYEDSGEYEVVRYVVCNTCGATCSDPDTLPEKNAYDAWNTRTAIEANQLSDKICDLTNRLHDANQSIANLEANLRAAIEAATEQGKRQPLTGEQLRDVARAFKGNTQQRLRDHWDEVEAFVREVEAAHGITATPQGTRGNHG